MFKKRLFTLIAASILVTAINPANTSIAGTCASKCGTKALQFTPGQRIRLEVVNSTPNVVKLEKVQNSNPITLKPGQKLQLAQENGTEQNISLFFWNETGLSLRGIVSKPDIATLRLEIRPTSHYPGHRSLYILNDGHINLF